ncbi:MAG: AAA family ATPase [Croceivirga sp.]
MGQPNTSDLKISVRNQPLDVELKTSASVIYLVGANGAGKSRFIEGLKSSKAVIYIDRLSKYRVIPFRFLDWGRCEYDPDKSALQNYQDIKSTLEIFNQDSIISEESITKGKREYIDGRWQTPNLSVEIPKLNGIEFKGINHLSEGTRKFHQLFDWSINDGLKKERFPKNYAQRTPRLYVIGIEEPEIHLHPKMQKLLPSYLEKWIIQQGTHKNIPLLIVVSTHSPFVIKGASKFKNSQKIYGLEKCKLIDLTGRENQQIAETGVSGSKSLIVANKMLGSGIGDFFPNPIIMAENSIIELLNNLSTSLDYSFEEFIISPKGDGDLEKRIANLQLMIKVLKRMQKSFPSRELFDFKIIVVVDDIAKAEDIKLKYKKVSEFDVEIFGLGHKQLEDIYPKKFIDEFISLKYPKKRVWDKIEPINKYLTNELQIEAREKGLFKKELAEYIGKKIKSQEELEMELPSIAELLKKTEMK